MPPPEPSERAPSAPRPRSGGTAPATMEIPIEEEMRSAYIDYAMSVIVGRALPDVRDGLKPVHRRIMYAMNEMGLTPDKPTKKSARVVGEVLGKYHPHGDTAVYDSLVRMAQDFSLRYPLVEGQGNFGSVDGDNPAAMRYTECRLTPIASELLADLDLGTADFGDNFDASLQEPLVLPGKVPNLLINGSAGIAVGMATNLAPHRLGEVVDAILLQLETPDVPIAEIMRVLPGPDFPTGGIIQGTTGIQQAYATGRGIVRIRARIETIELHDKPALLVTEIPYQVNKSKLLQDIAQLVRDKKLEGIGDLRDESNREGMRVIIELKRNANPEVVKNQLYSHTQLQDSFGITNLALVGAEPKVLTIKGLLQLYIDHRVVVIVRRTEHLLRKAQERAHIVEGLLIALGRIDEVIAAIRAARDTEAARAALVDRFALSEEQAKAILDMRLGKLTQLETQSLKDELAKLKLDIARYQQILREPAEQRRIIREEVTELKRRFDDPRRTEIVAGQGDLLIQDLVPDDPVVILFTSAGYVKRVSLEAYKMQGRGGRGVIGMSTKETDYVVDVLTCTNHQDILFVTQKGIVHGLKAYQIPQGDRYAKGVPVVSLFERLDPDTRIQAALPVKEYTADEFLFFATRQGKVKKTALPEYEHININGKIAIKLEDGDELVGVCITNGANDIVVVKNSGKGVRFHEDQVRPMGRVAAGVRGCECRKGEEVVSMVIIEDAGAALLTVTTKGKGKRTPFDSFNPKNRGAWGVFMHEVDADETGPVVSAIEVSEKDEVLFTSKTGVVIRGAASEIRLIASGQAKGVIVQRLEEGDETVAVARLAREPGAGENGGPATPGANGAPPAA